MVLRHEVCAHLVFKKETLIFITYFLTSRNHDRFSRHHGDLVPRIF